MTCKITDCEIPGPFKRGWCRTHYMRWRRTGDPLVVRKPWESRERQPQQCSMDGCDKPTEWTGLCSRHYREKLAKGAPPCSRDECEKPSRASGLCEKHDAEARRRARGVLPRDRERPSCKECGTATARIPSGLCRRCYQRLYDQARHKSQPRQKRQAPPPRLTRGQWLERPDGVTVVHWPAKEGESCPVCAVASAQAA